MQIQACKTFLGLTPGRVVGHFTQVRRKGRLEIVEGRKQEEKRTNEFAAAEEAQRSASTVSMPLCCPFHSLAATAAERLPRKVAQMLAESCRMVAKVAQKLQNAFKGYPKVAQKLPNALGIR